MSNNGLKQARQLTSEGFHYDNLVKMAKHCREETHPDRILSAYILNRVFWKWPTILGMVRSSLTELRKLEARYRTAVNLALEKAIDGAPQDEKNSILTELIQLVDQAVNDPRISHMGMDSRSNGLRVRGMIIDDRNV